MPRRNRKLPEAFVENQEKMKRGELGPKKKPKKTTRKSSAKKPRKS
jgi:hypothetical protein